MRSSAGRSDGFIGGPDWPIFARRESTMRFSSAEMSETSPAGIVAPDGAGTERTDAFFGVRGVTSRRHRLTSGRARSL